MAKKNKEKKKKKNEFEMPKQAFLPIPTEEDLEAEDGGIARFPAYVNADELLKRETSKACRDGVRVAVYELVGYATLQQNTIQSEIEFVSGPRDDATHEG